MKKALSSSRTGESTWRASFRLASREPSAHLRTQLPTRYPQHQKVQRARSTKKPARGAGLSGAADGTRTHDLLHGKQWLNGGFAPSMREPGQHDARGLPAITVGSGSEWVMGKTAVPAECSAGPGSRASSDWHALPCPIGAIG